MYQFLWEDIEEATIKYTWSQEFYTQLAKTENKKEAPSRPKKVLLIYHFGYNWALGTTDPNTHD